MSIYGNSKEDKFYESKLDEYLTDVVINKNVSFEDFQIIIDNNNYSFDGVAIIVDGNIIELVLDFAGVQLKDGDFEALSDIESFEEILLDKNDFVDYIFEQLSK